VVRSGDPFRRFTGRRDEPGTEVPDMPPSVVLPAAVESPVVREDYFTARGTGSCGLSR
jgi:hypothetical protein